MAESKFQQPTDKQLEDFVKGDPIAIDQVIVQVAGQLCQWAWHEYPDLPSDEVEQVVFDALLETARNHARYDPSKSLFTTYVINLINWRISRLIKKVQKIRNHEDTSEEAQEKLSRGVYNQERAGNIEVKIDIRIARERFYTAAREKLQGLDREFFELMLQGAVSSDYVNAVKREGSFLDPDIEAKNRKPRVHRKLKDLAEELGYELGDLLKE